MLDVIGRMLQILLLLAGIQAEVQFEEHTQISGEDSSFTCSSNQQGTAQTVFVDFTAFGSQSEENVYHYSIGTDQTIVETVNRDGKYKTDGTRITIQEVQLADEGIYVCTIRIPPNKIVVQNNLTVTIKPTVEEIEDLSDAPNELVDVTDSGSKKEKRDVAKCIANGAKPKATISWEFDNTRGLKHEDTIDYDQEIDRLWQSSSTLQIIPEKMYHGEKVTCIVKWESMPEVRKSYVINVQYKAQLPNLKPNLAQQEVSCFADGNPEPTIMWTLPDGSVREGTTVEMQDTGNPNATYKCTAQNKWGRADVSKTSAQLAAYTEPVETADMGIIIGVAVAAVLVLCLIAYLIYRFVLDPQQNEKDSFVGHNYTTGGQRDHYVGGSQNIYRPQHDSRKKSVDDTDSDAGMDEPPQIVSHNSARYHKDRRSNTNLRHSPSRGPSQEKQQQHFDYIAPSSEIMDNEDEMIDDAANRYADYQPGYYTTTNTTPYKDQYVSINKEPAPARSSNRLDYAHIGTESQMV